MLGQALRVQLLTATTTVLTGINLQIHSVFQGKDPGIPTRP